MIPEVKQTTKIDAGLQLICATPQSEFPAEHVQKAKYLFEKWEDERWGANEVVEDDASEDEAEKRDDEHTEKPRKTSTTVKAKENNGGEAKETATIRLPPANHLVFGTEGIMHGVAIKSGKRRNYNQDPRYRHTKRDAKVYGSNGLQVGAWFPMQIITLIRGAYGSAMGGISGNKETGTYSIVVAVFYDDSDQENGYILSYSGSNSHDNGDRRTPSKSSTGTLALQASLASEKPVRVLRAATGKSQ